MKTTKKLEIFADNYIEYEKHIRKTIGNKLFGKRPHGFWIAKITGTDPKYGFNREFLPYKKDYSESNSKGSRGVYAYYILESGIYYEIKEQISWNRTKRYFCKIDESGDIITVNKEEIIKWTKQQKEEKKQSE